MAMSAWSGLGAGAAGEATALALRPTTRPPSAWQARLRNSRRVDARSKAWRASPRATGSGPAGFAFILDPRNLRHELVERGESDVGAGRELGRHMRWERRQRGITHEEH